jgi:hypothetical protein
MTGVFAAAPYRAGRAANTSPTANVAAVIASLKKNTPTSKSSFQRFD